MADDSVAEDKNTLPADELDEDAPGWGDQTQEESAAVFLLKTPTSRPGSNDPSQWAPDNSECKWVGKVKTYGAAWEDNGKNILTNVSDYVVSWPGGATGDAWSLKPGDDYWDEVVDEIWDEYKDTIEEATGVEGLTQDDLESIVVTPYKISRSNGTKPDKHIDCIISVKSRKNFTARFNVRAPGEDDYSIRESREYQSGERVEETTADIEKELDIGGARYVFDGWYKELPGSVTDEPDPKEKVSQDEWEEGYEPTEDNEETNVKTRDAWSLKPGDDYWDEVVDEIWDEYKDTIEKQTGITGLTQDDLESIVVTPYKISRKNGTKPDKHIDCIISVKSRKNFTARFNVRAPGENDYSIRESREYQSGERVEGTTADIEKELDIGGARYVFDGWYKELPGSVTDEPDPKEKVSQDEWEEGYEPTDEKLENGVVNF